MDELLIHSERGPYPVAFLSGDAGELGGRIAQVASSGRLHFISDSTVAPLHAEPIVAALREMGREVHLHRFPAGETFKRLETVAALWDAILGSPLDRGDTIVAVGGGVTGDVAGFVASTLLRGLRVVHVPTSLLAMADSSIGGKTGINVRAGKNLVGAFHAPAAVFGWLPALRTLPERELRSGLAEVIKCAWIEGESAVAHLESAAEAIARRDQEALAWAVRMAARVKADLVASDERESGDRVLLNLGHTFAHAIEHAQGYGSWSHGEAVGVGLILAAQLSVALGEAERSVPDRVQRLLVAFDLPRNPPRLTMDQWIGPIRRDKKRSGSELRFVLLSDPGSVFVREVPMSTLTAWLHELRDSQ